MIVQEVMLVHEALPHHYRLCITFIGLSFTHAIAFLLFEAASQICNISSTKLQPILQQRRVQYDLFFGVFFDFFGPENSSSLKNFKRLAEVYSVFTFKVETTR